MIDLFAATVDRSAQASVAIILVLAVRRWGALPVRWQYGLWLIPMARMILPWSIDTGICLGNLLPGPEPGPLMFGSVVNGAESIASFISNHLLGEKENLRLFGEQELSLLIPALMLIWGIGVAIMAGVMAVPSALSLRKIRKNRQVVCETTLDHLEKCKARMGVRTPLVVMETDQVPGPVLFGWLRPRILLPRGMISRLKPSALDAVFFHELGHLRQQDILLQYLGFSLLALHWFNPLAWVMAHLMGRDRERACDALALSNMTHQERQTYGQVLLSMASPASVTLPGFAGIAESASDIKRRIQMIAGFEKTSMGRTLRLTVGLLLLTISVFAVGPGLAGSTPVSDLPELSQKLTTHMSAGEHTMVVRNFDATMSHAMDQEKLKSTWDALVSQVGQFKQILETREATEQGYQAVYVTCGFEKATLDIKFVFNDKAQISGLWILPAGAK